MKKLMIGIFIVMTSASLAIAHGPRFSNSGDNSKVYAEMDSVREIMHYGQTKAQKLKDGIRVMITADDQKLTENIKQRFIKDKENVNKYFNRIDVKVTELKKGVNITFTSDDAKMAEEIQYYGPVLAHHYLRDTTFDKLERSGRRFGCPYFGSYSGMDSRGRGHHMGSGRGFMRHGFEPHMSDYEYTNSPVK